MLTLKQHNIMDYVHGSLVAASPFIFGFSKVVRARNALLGAGLGTIGYSSITKYDYSLAKLIPLGPHMALDLISGATVAAAPWIAGYHRRLTKFQLGLHIALGIGAGIVVAMTQPKTEQGKVEFTGPEELAELGEAA